MINEEQKFDQRVDDNSTNREQTDKFACPGCGANMTFNPDTQSLYCEYCGKTIDIARQNDIDEHDFYTANDNAKSWGNEKRVFRCDSCGAETVLDTFETARFCAFCGSSHVVKLDENAGIPPESLIPFKVSDKKARELFRNWLRKRFFTPKVAKSESHINKMTGVYVPFWTFDADTSSAYVAEKGTYYYVTRTHYVTRNGKREKVTTTERRIRWQWVSGLYSKFFDDVLVNASRNTDAKLMKKLEPFDLKELVRYDPKFLSGYLAERYSIGLDPGWEIAKQDIKESIRRGIIAKINGDEVRNLSINTHFSNIKYKHILVPVWMASYKYRDKIYRFLVNGQTGEVQGYAPISPWKVALIVIGVIALIGLGLLYFSSYRM